LGMEKVILKNKQMPLHYQIADYLLNIIKNSEIPIADRLMPEEGLSDMFGVSRATVRHALDHLSGQGMIIKKQGKGNFWTDASQQLRKEKQSGINREIFKVSEKTTVKVVSKELEGAPDAAAEFLGLPKGAEVYKFNRLRYLGSDPFSFTINYVPKVFGKKILKRHLKKMMMLETLENVVGLELGIVEHEVEINRADTLIAANLGVAPLDPVLAVKTSVYDKEHRPVEIVWTYFVENKYKFKVVLDK
jgi:GntR family transcriptional regulator